MSLSFVNKSIKDSIGTKVSFGIWIISIALLALQAKYLVPNGKSLWELQGWQSYASLVNIGIGVLAFIFLIYFVIRQSIVIKPNKGKNKPGTNPWAVSTAILLIVLAFIAGKSIAVPKQKDFPDSQIINAEPTKTIYQQVIVQPRNIVTSAPIQTKVPVSFSDGSTRNCDQNAVQALRDADSSLSRAQQEKSQCNGKYSQQNINSKSSCDKTCYSFYEDQTEKNRCLEECSTYFFKLNQNSTNICDTYSSSQKANLDYLINKYCK